MLDLRVSRPIRAGRFGRIELIADVLNALNSTAQEAIASDNKFSPTFGQPTVFVDPRRAMLERHRARRRRRPRWSAGVAPARRAPTGPAPRPRR